MRSEAPPSDGLLLGREIELAEPIDQSGSLDVFRRPGDDLLDRFDGKRLIRTLPVGDRFAPYVCEVREGLVRSLKVVVLRTDFAAITGTIPSGLFVTTGEDWPRLLAEDPVIEKLDRTHPGVRPVLQHDLFTALVRSISAQQINLRWAATIRARLAQQYGDKHVVGDEFVYSLDVERIAAADAATIRDMQFTTRKAEAIVELAQQFADGSLSLDAIRRLDDDEIISRLICLRGLGLWSAEWILARTLGRPRVVAGDLGVRKAVGRAYLGGRMPSELEVREVTAHWRDSAQVAQALLLHAMAVGTT